MNQEPTDQPTYRDRRIARAERLQGWAAKREAKAEADYQRAHEMAQAIPFGQPILVGHHSERGDRSYRARMTSTFDRSFENARKADEMASKASNILAQADHAIYSDDPDAVERLEAKLAGLEAERAAVKGYNASCRKGQPNPELLPAAWQEKLDNIKRYASFQLGKGGALPSYALSNLSGTITATRKRLEDLSR